MNEYAYFNGSFSLLKSTAVPLTDRSIYFGDGCYDVLLLKDGMPYQLELHLERLLKNCRRLKIPFSMTAREILSVIHRLSDLCCIPTGVIYIQVNRNGEKRKHEICEGYNANVLVTLSKYEIPRQHPLTAITVPDKRHEICDVKSLNLLYSVLSLQEANARGCDCAIFVRNGYITEEARSNVFIYRNNELITRPLDEYILPGITRRNVINVAQELGVRVTERRFDEDEMLNSDEVFVCSTTKFIQRISHVNGLPCGMKNGVIYFRIYENIVNNFIHIIG